jgi:ATP-dependent exoDNAse (exonuclease V) alpha subunit
VAGRALRQAVAVERIDGQRSGRLDKYTTRDLMKAERDVLRVAIERRGDALHMVSQQAIEAALARTALAKGYQLNPEQRAAVEKLAGTAGGVQVMVGDAGTGKSSTLHAVREAHEAEGLRVIGTSSGGKASAELMASSGIDSRSIAKLCSDLERGRDQLDARTVLVIDEAGMTSSRDMATLMRAADDAGAKVILVGDWKQLQPVGAGETFRALDQELGSARLEQINRQNQEWERGTVKELSQGEAAQALKTYAEQGRIHIDATYQKAIKDVATRHVENMREVGQDKAVALAGTRQAVDHINEAVRSELKRDGQLAEGEKFTTKDEQRNTGSREIELAKGDRVMIGTTDTEKGYTNGDAGRVVGMDAKTGTIDVKLDRTGETVKVNTQEAEVRHGYAMTTHKSQGSTYERATVYLDSNTSREMAYVQASRAKDETHFVTTRHSVDEMRRDTPAPEALQKAVDQVASAREAVGKDAGLEPTTRQNYAEALAYVQANKEYAPKEAIREAKNAATMDALANAMSRSRPKETTLDYQAKPGQDAGRQRLERTDQPRESGRDWKESLSRVEQAVAAREQAAEARQPSQDTGRGYER